MSMVIERLFYPFFNETTLLQLRYIVVYFFVLMTGYVNREKLLGRVHKKIIFLIFRSTPSLEKLLVFRYVNKYLDQNLQKCSLALTEQSIVLFELLLFFLGKELDS